MPWHIKKVELEVVGSTDSSSNLFYWGVCSVCRNSAPHREHLLRCGRCHAVYYCSAAHQRQHWPEHGFLCRFLSGEARAAGRPSVFAGLRGLDRLQRAQASQVLQAKWEAVAAIKHGRAVAMAEQDVMLYPRVCCAPGCGLAPPAAPMVDCFDCRAVAYCGSEHKEQEAAQHATHCRHLRLARLMDLHEAEHGCGGVGHDPGFPEALDSEWLGAESVLVNAVAMFDELDSSRGCLRYLSAPELQLSCLSEQLSAPLTLLLAAAALVPGLASARELLLHMPGAGGGAAAGEVLGGLGRWEFLAHRLPALRRLAVALVGPDLPEEPARNEEECGGCRALGRRVEVVRHRGTYSDFQLGTHPDSMRAPHLILVQNCGFHAGVWTPQGLRSLVRQTVPLLFTSYDMAEAEEDLAALRAAAGPLEVLRGPETNPVRSRRGCVMEPRVYFTNAIITIVRRKE